MSISQRSSQIGCTQDQPSQITDNKILPTVLEFSWVEIKPTETIEVNYLDSFFKKHPGATFDYYSLGIPKADPNPDEERGPKFDLASLHTRLSKWGGLSLHNAKKKKGGDEDYDVDDSFIDDVEGEEKVEHNPGFVESNFDDFVCFRGDLKAFKASEYYGDRVASIKQSIKNVKEEEVKKKKKSPRRSSKEKLLENLDQKPKGKKAVTHKRKRTDNTEQIVRPQKELKAQKNTSKSRESIDSSNSSKSQAIRISFKKEPVKEGA